MVDGADPADELVYQGPVQDRALDELDRRMIQYRGEVLLAARAQVVEDDDILAAAEQALGQMGADETGAAGDKRCHFLCLQGGRARSWNSSDDQGRLVRRLRPSAAGRAGWRYCPGRRGKDVSPMIALTGFHAGFTKASPRSAPWPV